MCKISHIILIIILEARGSIKEFASPLPDGIISISGRPKCRCVKGNVESYGRMNLIVVIKSVTFLLFLKGQVKITECITPVRYILITNAGCCFNFCFL